MVVTPIVIFTKFDNLLRNIETNFSQINENFRQLPDAKNKVRLKAENVITEYIRDVQKSIHGTKFFIYNLCPNRNYRYRIVDDDGGKCSA